MPDLTFHTNPAYVFHCPICVERHIGANPDDDPDTAAWIARHGKWHQHSSAAPPSGIILSPKSAGLGATTNGRP